MRTIQEQHRLAEASTIKKATQEIMGGFSVRTAARNLGTVAHLPPQVAPLPVYDEDGNAIEYFAYGDAYGGELLRG